MRLVSLFFLVLLISLGVSSASQPIKILIITGGHDFERPEFFDMFKSMDGIEFTSVEHPTANSIYATPSLADYDVLVYYDMNQDISDDQKAAFLQMVEHGKGLVFLHHSLASYQLWEKYLRIQGGRYHLEPEDESKKSTYRHDVDMNVSVLDAEHPVTRGISDFTIHDEVYGNFEVLPQVHPLLGTDHPESGAIIGWANDLGASKSIYLQLGHDRHAYANPNFQTLVKQAILWTAGRE